MEHLTLSRELGEHMGLPQNPYRWRTGLARIREAEGNLDDALDLLSAAERVYVSDFSPHVRPVAAMKARVLAKQGRLGEALAWATAQGVTVEDELTYLHEFEHITLARVLLTDNADASRQQAVELLERLLHAAEQGNRAGNVLEILVLQALAQQMRGDISAALAPLERALRLAEPEGCVRIFVDEGPVMAVLLEAALRHKISPNYAGRLLAALAPAAQTAAHGLIEPLSERELDVLRLLATDLGGPEIARELVVSLNTVRTHTKNIYNKLGVNNRRAAVSRAEDLHLLTRRR